MNTSSVYACYHLKTGHVQYHAAGALACAQYCSDAAAVASLMLEKEMGQRVGQTPAQCFMSITMNAASQHNNQNRLMKLIFRTD